MPVPDGSNTIVNYYWEDGGYAQPTADATAKVPGSDAQLTTATATNNGTRFWLPASRIAVVIKEGPFDGSFALQCRLTNPWWVRMIRGAPATTDNLDGSYTHTWDGTPDSFKLVEGYETTGTERTFEGCVAARASINPTVANAYTQVTIEGFYASESKTTPAELTGQTQLSEEVLDFSDAVLTLGGAAQSIVQDATLSLAWENLDGVLGWGSRFPVDYVVGNFAPTIDYTKVKVDDAPLTDVYGGSTTSMQEDIENTKALSIAFDNGKTAGAGIQTMAFDAPLSFPNSYGETGVGDPTARIDENLNRLIDDVAIEATNEVAAAP